MCFSISQLQTLIFWGFNLGTLVFRDLDLLGFHIQDQALGLSSSILTGKVGSPLRAGDHAIQRDMQYGQPNWAVVSAQPVLSL